MYLQYNSTVFTSSYLPSTNLPFRECIQHTTLDVLARHIKVEVEGC